MISTENVMSAGEAEKSVFSDNIRLTSKDAIVKNYLDILKELLAEKEITQQEYSELKQNYEYNLQRHSF